MSIERNRFGFDGEISFECDVCGDELHTDTANFESAREKLRAEGWQTRKRKGDWEHVCPGCQDDEHGE